MSSSAQRNLDPSELGSGFSQGNWRSDDRGGRPLSLVPAEPADDVGPAGVRQSPRKSRRVALIGLSDESAPVLERYAISCDWVIAAVVVTRPGGAVAEIATSLRIPVCGSLDRTVLNACDTIVVGDIDGNLREILSAMIDPSRTRMIGVADAMETFRVTDVAPPTTQEEVEPFEEVEGSVLLAAEYLLGPCEAGVPRFLRIDVTHPAVLDALESLSRETGAFFVSLMFPTDGGRRLQVAATAGPKRTVPAGRLAYIGSGLAGKAFSERKFQIRHEPLPNLAEEEEDRLIRVAASCPVMVSGELIGVLSLNIDTCDDIEEESIRSQMESGAKSIGRTVLGSIQMETYPLDACRVLLPRIVDRILSQDEPLADRVLSVTQALRRTLHGADAHLYLVDRLHDRLRPMGVDDSGGSEGDLVSRGLLRLALRHRGPQVLEFTPVDPQQQTGIVCQPIYLTRPYGLICVDSVPLGDGLREEALRVMAETVRQVEEMIGVEEQVAAQDLIQELEMRIADRSSFLTATDPNHPIRRVLDLAMDVVAAETAVWIPARKGNPVAAAPSSSQAAQILATIWPHTASLSDRVWEEGAIMGQINPALYDPDSTHMIVPYVGVMSDDKRGALIAFFAPDDRGGVPAQVSPELLWRILRKVCGLVPGQSDGSEATTSRLADSYPAP